MKITAILFSAVAVGAVCADNTGCPFSQWQPETETDTRGVCPMLNALSNHGYLPHNGRDMTKDQIVGGLKEALNLAPSFGEFLWGAALQSAEAVNKTKFNLNHLDYHNLFEHDGSLSRQDAYFGQWSRFNATVFEWTEAYWPGDTLDVQIVAAARASRHMRSALTNPDYSLSDTGYSFSMGENSALLSIIGDKHSQTVPKNWIEYFFENERLPCSLGWKKPAEEITLQNLIDTFHSIENATFFPIPPPEDEKSASKTRRWTHAGFH
ncbi:Cloroperoxidase [Xylariaceae sp. FL1019]|nr:Cloroperoxidase [Xylariaceae sp. FL1019]